jgi:two-component system chemotaxis response regulator CheY
MPNALVVDDSRVIRRILAGTLSEIGYQVAQAADGVEALAMLEQAHAAGAPVALMLVDWNMPQMNGLEVVRRVRADARCADTMVIMVTTETEVGQMVVALQAGANEYVMKPFTKEVIEDKLRLLGVLQ